MRRASAPPPNRCRAVVPADTIRLRQAAEKKLQQLRTQFAKLEADLTHFHEIETRAYKEWVCQNLGALRTRLIEAVQRSRANLALVDRVRQVMFILGISRSEAYGRVRDEMDGKGPAIPEAERQAASEEDEFAGNPFAGSPTDSESRPDDDAESFVEELFEALLNGGPLPGFGSDGTGTGAAKAEREDRQKELTRVYRALVKQLHPDRGGSMTEEQTNLWHAAQAAYDAGDLERLEACLERCGSGIASPALERTLASILKQQRELLRSVRQAREEIKTLKRSDPAWGFLKLKDPALRLAITRQRLEEDIASAEDFLESTEMEIAEIEQMHRKWVERKEKPRKQPKSTAKGAAKVRRPPTNAGDDDDVPF